MKRIIFIGLILFSFLFVGFVLGAATVTNTPAAPPVNLTSDGILRKVNAFRKASDLTPLVETDEICQLAQERLSYIVENNTVAIYNYRPEVAHNGLELFQKRYSKTFLSEVWNANYKTDEAATLGWLTSKAHLENILYPDFTEGCVATNSYVTVLLLGII